MKDKALLIRLDRIGDLVLTLPADRQMALRNYDCQWFITRGLGFVADHANPPRRHWDGEKKFSLAQTLRFYFQVKALAPKVSVSFHAPWWVNMVLFLAGVPTRVGVLSQWHSYLFLNRGVRQKRSLCEHHELEYNHLLVHAGLNDPNPPVFPHLPLTAKLEPLPAPLPERYAVIHPGMSGSALNWPVENYAEFIRLVSRKMPVVITGTAGDAFMLDPLREILGENPSILWRNTQYNGPQLLRVLKGASFVFAPSTGVIHLAASLGVPTYGIYSPVKVESAARWGPRGDRVQIATPSKDHAGQQEKHLAAHSMALVSPQEIYDSISVLKN